MKVLAIMIAVFATSAIASPVVETSIQNLDERQLTCAPTLPCINGSRCCGGRLTYRCNAC